MRRVVVLLVAVAFAACSTMPVVPTKLNGQAAAQLTRDESECADQTRGRDERDTAYAACMIARGYTMYVTSHRVPFDLRQTQQHDPDAVLADVRACDDVALKAQADESGGEKAGRIAGTVALALFFAPVALATMGPNAELVSSAFTSCMAPRGYAIERWRQ